MESNSVAGGSAPSSAEMTPAQRLMALHQNHQPTMEDVVDESDLPRSMPTPISTPEARTDSTATDVPSTMSAKAAGKQRAQETPAANGTAFATNAKIQLDMQSEEAFPSLGAPKASSAASSTWSSKPASVRRSNGIHDSTAAVSTSSGASTPMSGHRAEAQSRSASLPMAIPGRHTQDMRIELSQLKQKADLKKPITELLRDLNKRSKAKVEMKSGPGVVIFTGQGPSSEVVVQALKDVAAEVSAKVCTVLCPFRIIAVMLTTDSKMSKCLSKRHSDHRSSGSRAPRFKQSSRNPALVYKCQEPRFCPLTWTMTQ